MGQILHRLVRPYLRLPLGIAQLVDSSRSEDDRLELATNLCQLPNCCVDEFFGKPVLKAIRDEGGAQAAIDGRVANDIRLAVRGQVSNVEVELNFSRAACSRHSNHGRAHNIGTMVSKHVSAEVKLGHRRYLARLGYQKKPSNAAGSSPGHSGLFCYVMLKHVT